MTGITTKGAATRRAIITAAAGVFAQHGYAGTRMEDIFTATGLTKGAVYFHFSSKLDLAQAVVADYKQRWLGLASDAIAGDDNPETQLRKLAELLIHLTTTDEASWSVIRLAEHLARHQESSPGHSDVSPMAAWVALVTEIIARGQRSGSFRSEQSAGDTAMLMVSAFDGLKTASELQSRADREVFTRRAHLLVHMLESTLLA